MSHSVKIVALNVNHRTNHKPLPHELTAKLLGLKPDILILNEYVEAHERTRFRNDLDDAGFRSILSSERFEYAPGRYTNQVLIASREITQAVKLADDAPDLHAAANILVVQTMGLTVAGLRAPSYPKETSRNKAMYWDWISRNLCADIVIGDFNFDPSKNKKHQKVPRDLLTARGWEFVRTTGDWSYQGNTQNHSKIDHAVVQKHIQVIESHYVYEGIVPEHTDHAALCVCIQRS